MPTQYTTTINYHASDAPSPAAESTIFFGTNDIGTIYYGLNKIGKIYYGTNLIYEEATLPVLYNITTTITNGTYSGPAHLYEGQTTATITLSADAGYALPNSITVSGASYTYSSSTGEVVLSSFTGNVTISAVCVSTVVPYLTFSSPNSFTVNIVDNKKYWDGTIQYSTNKTTRNTWNGTTTLSSASDGTKHNLYFRGTGNRYITGSSASNTAARWVLTGSNISCDGNIENLLDYQTVSNGNHPNMATYCYAHMFYGCSNLTTAPSLPATTLVTSCYRGMFRGCTSLTTAPTLPATTLAYNCYYYMFYGCTSLTSVPNLPATTLTDYCYYYMFYGCTSLTTAPALPATTLATYCYAYMFKDCTSLTTPSIMAGGTTQATAAKNCCYYMYNNCTSLNIYSSSSGHTAFYKALAYSAGSSSNLTYRSSYRMFYSCKINGSSSTTDYLTAGTQYYY